MAQTCNGTVHHVQASDHASRKNAELIPSSLLKSSATKWGEEWWSRVDSITMYQSLLGRCCPYEVQWICTDFQQQEKPHQPEGMFSPSDTTSLSPYLTPGNKCWVGDVTERCHHTRAHLPINMAPTASSWTKVHNFCPISVLSCATLGTVRRSTQLNDSL